MLPPRTPQDEADYQWLIEHLRSCQVCELRNEDDSGYLCHDLEAYLRRLRTVYQPVQLPGFDDVPARPAEGRPSWTA
jgi:hypothetical protein